jgi:hypothetical protein
MTRGPRILNGTPAAVLSTGLAAVIGAALIGASFPWYDELPIHRVILRQFAETGAITQHTFPFLYGGIAALAELSIGQYPLHLALYFLSVALVLLLGRRYGLCGPGLAALGLLAAWHPYMLLGTIRLNDNAVNVPLMLGFALALALWKRDGGHARAALFGLVFGVFFCSRANVGLLALVPLAMLAFPRAFGETRMRARELGAAVAGFLLAWIGLSGLFTDTWVFFPQNGPYNLFVGANPFSAEALLARNNAEYSLAPALALYGIEIPKGVHQWVYDPSVYRGYAFGFIFHHPLEYVWLAVLKAKVYFGPDLVYADGVLEVAAQWLTACVQPLWLLVAFLAWRLTGRRVRPEVALILVLYALPFLAINADPRFRLPADLLALVDGAARAAMLWSATRRDTTAATHGGGTS